jgi:hypothetical protein
MAYIQNGEINSTTPPVSAVVFLPVTPPAVTPMPLCPVGLSQINLNAGTQPSNWSTSAAAIPGIRISNQGGRP